MFNFPSEWMQNLSETTSEEEWAQQEPHFPWSLTGWMQSGDFSLQSKLSGSWIPYTWGCKNIESIVS